MAAVRSSTGATASRATRSLRARNFRLYFTGQGVSLVGTWMHRVAMGWLVYSLTGSALMLGLVGFAGRIPTLLLAPFAGVAADRWDRRRILYATQSLSMLQALLLATLVLSGAIQLWHVLALLLMRVTPVEPSGRAGGVLANLQEGFAFAWGFPEGDPADGTFYFNRC